MIRKAKAVWRGAGREGDGFKITRSALTLRAEPPGLDKATFDRLAGEAEKNCPLSKVINTEIKLDATLV